MTIHNWRHVDTVGGLRGDPKQPTAVEYRAPRVTHPERLAHAGSMSGPARESKSDRRWLIFVMILCPLLLAALIILTLPKP